MHSISSRIRSSCTNYVFNMSTRKCYWHICNLYVRCTMYYEMIVVFNKYGIFIFSRNLTRDSCCQESNYAIRINEEQTYKAHFVQFFKILVVDGAWRLLRYTCFWLAGLSNIFKQHHFSFKTYGFAPQFFVFFVNLQYWTKLRFYGYHLLLKSPRYWKT